MSDVELISLTCNHCGAPLEAPTSARFLSCQHCGSRLKVMTKGNAAWTEVQEQVAAIAERQDDMAEELAVIRLQNELEALDRDWERYRERNLVHHKDRAPSEPSVAGGITFIVFGVIGGLGFFAVSSGMGAPGLFPLAGIGFAAFGIVGGILGMKKGQAYEASRRRYQRERSTLQRRIRAAARD